MRDNGIKSKLENIPDIVTAIKQLFSKAKSNNHVNYLNAIKGISKIQGYPEKYEDRIVQEMTQHFAEFYSWFKGQKIEKKEVRYILQFVNYGLFWENTAIQRLLSSLVEIAHTAKFNIPVLLVTEHKTNRFFEKLISDAKKASLDIALVIEALYNNQIRNAAAHAQIFFFDKGITLMNHRSDLTSTIPSISYAVWDRLYMKTEEFIETLFSKRLDEYKALRS